MIAIGDITERCLRFFGITKERVQAATGKKQCGCAKRQEAMNNWGFRWQQRIFFLYDFLLGGLRAFQRAKLALRMRKAIYYFGLGLRALFYGR